MRQSRHWPRIRCIVCEKEFSPYKHAHRRQCCSDACRRQHDEAKYVVKRTLSAVDAAYIAGLVDGEGTLSIWRESQPENKTGFKSVITFTIAQANQPFLEDIREILGNGRIYSTGRVKNPKHKKCFQLGFKRHQTRWILPQLIPYLRIKRRQAELVMQCLDTLDRSSRRDGDAHAERAALYHECHALNQRGIPNGSSAETPGQET